MKTLFLTGGNGEIGSAILDKFKQNGFQIIAPSRKELNLENTESTDAFIQKLNHNIEVFVHCAGFNEPKPISEISEHDIQKTMQINALSFYKIVNYLVKNKKISNNGYIAAISSIYASLARKGRFSYVASKHCLNGMIKTLALELGHLNIKSNVVSPGFVDTQMTRRNNSPATIQGFEQKIPLGRLATVTDIAEVVYFMCSSQNRYINGQEIVVDGGYSIGGFEQ